jgi:quinol monooxygenase YgiN
VYRDEAAREEHRAAPHYQVWKAAAHTLDGPTERIETRSVFPSDPKYWFKENGDAS